MKTMRWLMIGGLFWLLTASAAWAGTDDEDTEFDRGEFILICGHAFHAGDDCVFWPLRFYLYPWEGGLHLGSIGPRVIAAVYEATHHPWPDNPLTNQESQTLIGYWDPGYPTRWEQWEAQNYEINRLLTTLIEEDASVRRQAVLQLGRWKVLRTLHALAAVLRWDTDATVRQSAALALARIDASAAQVELPVLRRVARQDCSSRVRQAAQSAVETIAGTTDDQFDESEVAAVFIPTADFVLKSMFPRMCLNYYPLVSEAELDGSGSWEGRRRRVERFEDEEYWRPARIELPHSENADASRTARHSHTIDTAPAEVVAAVAEAIGLPKPITQWDQASVGSCLPWVSEESVREVALADYLEMLTDPEESVRLESLAQLGRSLTARCVSPLTALLSHDPSPAVREAAARLLGRIESGKTWCIVPVLQRTVMDDGEPRVRRAARFALEQLQETP